MFLFCFVLKTDLFNSSTQECPGVAMDSAGPAGNLSKRY